jgi:hypothetical protein
VFYFSNVLLAKPSDSLSVRQLGVLIHAMSRLTPSEAWTALSMRVDSATTAVSGNYAVPLTVFRAQYAMLFASHSRRLRRCL